MSTSSINPSDRRAQERHALTLKLCCKSVDLGGGMPWQGESRDLSFQGIRLVTERSFQPRTMLLIDFKGDDELPVRSLMARVMWTERNDGGGWTLGCSLMDHLSEDEIASLQVNNQAVSKALAPLLHFENIKLLRRRLQTMTFSIQLPSRQKAAKATDPAVRPTRKTYTALPSPPHRLREAAAKQETPRPAPTAAPARTTPAPPAAATPAAASAAPAAPPTPPKPTAAEQSAALAQQMFDRLTEQLEAADLRPARRTLQGLLQMTPGDAEYVEMLAQVNDQVVSQQVGQLTAFTGHECEVNAVAFSPDGEHVFSASGGDWIDGFYTDGEDRSVCRADAAAGKEQARFREASSPILSIACAPSGTHLLAATRNGHIFYIDARDFSIFRRIANQRRMVGSIAFSKDGRRFLTGCDDGVVRLWDVEGKRLRRYTGHTRAVTAAAFSPDCTQAVSGSLDGSVRVWNVETGVSVHCLTGHGRAVRSAACSPDGARALSGGADGAMRLWDLRAGHEIKALTGHHGPVMAVLFTADGERAVSAGSDDSIRLWDLERGVEIHQFTGHTAAVRCLALSPGGRRLLSGSADRTVRTWMLPE